MKKPVNTTNNAVITGEIANRLLDSYRQIYKKLAEYERKPITPNNSEKIAGFNKELKQVIVDARNNGYKFWYKFSRFNKIVYTIEPLEYTRANDVPETELIQYGYNRFAAGDTELAHDCYMRALKLHPNDKGLHENIAENYLFAGQPTEALATIEKLKVIAPEDNYAWIEYEALVREGKYNEAIASRQSERQWVDDKYPNARKSI